MKLRVEKTYISIIGKIELTSGMVGATIDVEFSDDWKGLSIVAVFSNGTVTKDILKPSDKVEIPWEVLVDADKNVTVGFYGYSLKNGNTVLAIPTVLCDIGLISVGTNPSYDPSAELTPSVAAQLDARITALEKGGGGEGTSTIAWKPTVDAQGNISWQRTSSKRVPETQNIKGPQGERGLQGPAYTLTDDDKATIVQAVIDDLPKYDGSVV